MAEITTGVRRLLNRPAVYRFVQFIFRADAGRREFVRDFVMPRADERLLDIGSGTSDLLDHLPAGVRYVGIEPSNEYSTAAVERFGARGVFITGLYDEARARDLGRFDIVVLSGVVHHLDDRSVLALYRLVHQVGLLPTGRLVSIDPVFVTDHPLLARCLISMDRGKNVRTPNEYLALASAVFPTCVGVTRHRRFPPYTHYIMNCRMDCGIAQKGDRLA